MSAFYGPPKEEQEMVKLIHHAVDLGITFFDTADVYGPHTNEILLGKVCLLFLRLQFLICVSVVAMALRSCMFLKRVSWILFISLSHPSVSYCEKGCNQPEGTAYIVFLFFDFSLEAVSRFKCYSIALICIFLW